MGSWPVDARTNSEYSYALYSGLRRLAGSKGTPPAETAAGKTENVNRITGNKQQASSGQHQVVHHIIILLLCVAILAGSLLFQLSEGELYLFGFKWPHRCLLYEIFGIKCALCGLTRSFCSLAHGNLRQAQRFHNLGAAIFAFICFQIPYRIYGIIIQPKRMGRKLTKINLSLAVTISILIFVNWLVYLGGLIL